MYTLLKTSPVCKFRQRANDSVLVLFMGLGNHTCASWLNIGVCFGCTWVEADWELGPIHAFQNFRYVQREVTLIQLRTNSSWGCKFPNYRIHCSRKYSTKIKKISKSQFLSLYLQYLLSCLLPSNVYSSYFHYVYMSQRLSTVYIKLLFLHNIIFLKPSFLVSNRAHRKNFIIYMCVYIYMD